MMTGDRSTLERPHLVRRRRWARIAIALVLCAQAVGLYVALARDPEQRVVTRVEHSANTTVLTIPTPPVIVPMPVATPSATDTRACPTPRTDAPRIIPGEIPDEVTNLAVSPTNAGWIAVWNERDVYISTNAGRSFRRRLAGDGKVHGVQFDCFGRAFVARGTLLGVLEGDRETWRAVPGLDLAEVDDGSDKVALIGGGRDLILVGEAQVNGPRARVAVSSDLGASWAYHELAEYTAAGEVVAGTQRADGTILVGTSIPDCMSEDIGWIQIAPDGTAKTHWMQIFGLHFQFWGDSIYSTHGVRKIDAPDSVGWAQYPHGSYYGTPIAAPYPVFVTEEKAARLVGTELREYPWKLEGTHVQMDPAGRLWSIACGKPWIARADRVSGYCAD